MPKKNPPSLTVQDWKNSQLSKYDWDFSSCHDDQAVICMNYEYSREVMWIHILYKMAITRFRGGHPFKKNDLFDSLAIFRDPNDKTRTFLKDLQLPLGFPTKAYLSLNHTPPNRQRVPKGGRLVGLGLAPIEIENEVKSHSTIFRINWNYSDKAILEVFADYLKFLRTSPPTQTRKGKSDIKDALTKLKALAAFRLLSKFTLPEAEKYTQEIKGKGFKLFSKPCDWYEAKQRAIKILKDDFLIDVDDSKAIAASVIENVRGWVIFRNPQNKKFFQDAKKFGRFIDIKTYMQYHATLNQNVTSAALFKKK